MSHIRVSGPNQIEQYSGPLAFIGDDLVSLVAQINTALRKLEPKVTEFSPRIVGTTLGGFGTYVFQYGRCIKTGRQVVATGAMQWSAHTGTGNMRIAGLPYRTSAELQGVSTFRAACALMGSSLTFSNQLVGWLPENSNEIRVMSFGSGASAAETAMDTSAALHFTAIYLTDED